MRDGVWCGRDYCFAALLNCILLVGGVVGGGVMAVVLGWWLLAIRLHCV